jgi:hypothetical protein
MKEVEKGAQSALQQPQSQQNQGVSNAVQESQGDVKQQGSESAEEEFYAVQILSVAKQLPKGAYDLRGRKDAKFIKAGNLYKYYIGGFSSRQAAAAELASLRKSFPGAFVIHIKGNKIVK